MSKISEYLNQILHARYGKDVRQSIHDAIHTCYEDGKAGATDLIAREMIENLKGEDVAIDAISGLTASDVQNALSEIYGKATKMYGTAINNYNSFDEFWNDNNNGSFFSIRTSSGSKDKAYELGIIPTNGNYSIIGCKIDGPSYGILIATVQSSTDVYVTAVRNGVVGWKKLVTEDILENYATNAEVESKYVSSEWLTPYRTNSSKTTHTFTIDVGMFYVTIGSASSGVLKNPSVYIAAIGTGDFAQATLITKTSNSEITGITYDATTKEVSITCNYSVRMIVSKI